MSISFNKEFSYTKEVVFLVQEGDDAPRPATEEDFRQAGFAPASEVAPDMDCLGCDDAGNEDEIIAELDFNVLPWIVRELMYEVFELVGDSNVPATAKLFTPLLAWVNNVSDVLALIDDYCDDCCKDAKASSADTAETAKKIIPGLDQYLEQNPAPTSSDLVDDLFNGAAKVFNFAKDGISGILDPFAYVESAKPAAEKPASVTPEPVAKKDEPSTKPEPSLFEEFGVPTLLGEFIGDVVKDAGNFLGDAGKALGLGDLKDDLFGSFFPSEKKASESAKQTNAAEDHDFFSTVKPSERRAEHESTKTEEEPEFNAEEQAVIDLFAQVGQEKHAADAMRKAKEFRGFLYSQKPTAEEARKFAEMLKNGKPPFFG